MGRVSKTQKRLFQYLCKRHDNVKDVGDKLYFANGKYYLAKKLYSDKILIYENRKREYKDKKITIALFHSIESKTPDEFHEFQYGQEDIGDWNVQYTRSFETRYIGVPYSVYWRLKQIGTYHYGTDNMAEVVKRLAEEFGKDKQIIH